MTTGGGRRDGDRRRDATPTVGDHAGGVAGAVVRLFRDDVERRRLAAAGRVFVERHAVWARSAEALERLCLLPRRNLTRRRLSCSHADRRPRRRARRSYVEAQERMSDPEIFSDRHAAGCGPAAAQGAGGALPPRAGLEGRARRRRHGARADADLRELLPEAEERLALLEEELKVAFVERDPNDAKDDRRGTTGGGWGRGGALGRRRCAC